MKRPYMNTEIKFNTDENAATIYVMKVLHTTVDKVWKHFTQKKLIDQWWAPKPWKCETTKMNFENDGEWHYAMVSPDNEKHFAGAHYHEINFHRSFDWTDFFADEEGNINNEMPGSNWLIGFTGVDEGTKLTINIHFKSRQDLQESLKMGFEQGFKSGLNQLEDLLNKKD